MIGNYLRFDFGKSYFRDVTVMQLIKEKAAGFDLARPLDDADLLSDLDPAWHPQSRERWHAIRHLVVGRHHYRLCHSGLFVCDPAHHPVRGRLVLQIFPLRGLTSDGWSQFPWWEKILDYFWHLTLPIISMGLAAFATMTLLTKNLFLEELRKQYVLTARAKGCSEQQVLYGHIFRNAMLLVVAGFPGAFVSAFFAGAL